MAPRPNEVKDTKTMPDSENMGQNRRGGGGTSREAL